MTSSDVTDPHDRRFMERALEEARRAADEEEVPVGAVVAHHGTLVGKAHNLVRTLRDPTAHAEILAITQAAAALENERLVGTTIYVTLEPCAMCMGALIEARVARVVFAAADPRLGACGSRLDLAALLGARDRIEIEGGLLAEPAAELLREFFRLRRGKEGG